MQNGKEDIKLNLLEDNKIVYAEYLNKYTYKLLELISEFSKAAG